MHFQILLLSALAGLTASLPTEIYPRQQTFTDCLGAANVPIVLQSSPSFKQLSSPYNLRLPYTPRVITLPTTAQQISATIKCASRFNIKVSARGGGHSYSAQGLGGANGHCVVDLQYLHEVVYEPSTQRCRVGGGARLGNIAQKLYDQARRAIPHGTCPAVGMGHAALGGFGISSRMWGLMGDNIVEVEIVTADGNIRKSKLNYNGDLFWALKGAGPSFGIITKFWFKTYPVTETNVNYSYRFGSLTPDAIAGAFIAIQDFARTAPKELGLGVSLWDGTGSAFELSGVYYGKQISEFNTLFSGLLSRLPRPFSTDITNKSWIETMIRYAGRPTLTVPETGYDEHTNFFAKSLVSSETSLLSRETMRNFFTYANTQGPIARDSGIPWFTIINLYGGGNSAISNKALLNETSYGHRDTLWNFQFYATLDGFTPQKNSSSVTFLNGMDRSVRRSQDGAYVNYADPTLSRSDAHRLYYGSQYERLRLVKKKFDGKQLFWYPQSIDPAP